MNISLPSLDIRFKGHVPITAELSNATLHKSVVLPSEFNQVGEVRLLDATHLVIAGMVNGDASEVIVLDPVRGVITDHFLCYDPAISKNGKYVAFLKFFPTHEDTNVDDRYGLYDVAFLRSEDKELRHHPGVAGRVIFPPSSENRPGDNVNVEGPLHEMVSDGFFWRDDSRLLAFADLFRNEYYVVVASVKAGQTIVDTARVPAPLICPHDVQPCFERLTRVQFLPEGSNSLMELTFRGYNGTPAVQSKVLLSKQENQLYVSPLVGPNIP